MTQTKYDAKIARLKSRLAALELQRRARLKTERDALARQVAALDAEIGGSALDNAIDDALAKRGTVTAVSVASAVDKARAPIQRRKVSSLATGLSKKAPAQREVLHILSGGKRQLTTIVRLSGLSAPVAWQTLNTLRKRGLVEKPQRGWYGLAATKQAAE